MREKLGKCITQIRGVSYTPADVRTADDSDAIPILRANNITESGIVYDDLIYIDKKCVKQSQLLCVGDILICASSGSKNLVGKAARITVNKVCSFGAFCKVIRSQTVDNDFLHYFFQSPYYRKNVSFASAGVNINNIRGEDIDNLEVDFPSLSEQRTSSKKIGKTFDLIAKRKQQLEKLDLLVKAKFYEMFGDPIVNLRGLPTVPLSRLAFLKSGKNVTSKDIHEYTDSTPYPCFGGNGIRGYVSKFSHDGEYCLIGRQGALCGNVQFAKGKFYATEHAVVVSLSQNDNTIWLYHCLKYLNLNRLQTGAAQPGLNIDILNQVDIPRPPLELQNEFAHFVEQTEKIKSKIKQSLEKLELLKQSLLQKYFG